MSHIFISYSHKDKEYVHKLHAALAARDIHAWIDDRIDFGSEWPDEIEKRLHECSAFVLVMTPSAKRSHWVRNELQNAIDREKPIFSLLLEGDIWWTMKTIQAADVKDGSLPPESFFHALLRIQAAAERNNSQMNASKNEINITGLVSNSIINLGDRNTIDNNVVDVQNRKLEAQNQSNAVPEQNVPVQNRNNAVKSSNIASQNQKIRTKGSNGAVLNPHAQQKAIQPKWKLTAIVAMMSACVATVLGLSILQKPDSVTRTPSQQTTATLTPIISGTLSATQSPTISRTPSISSSPTIAKTYTPTPTIYPPQITQKGAVMLLIPAGSFTMGSNNGNDDEKPPHTVTLSAFYMDKYEVSNALYKACMNANACSAPAERSSYSRSSYYYNSQFDNYPVIYVNWYQAKSYCLWRGGDLPSEAEWEYAARGTDGRIYPWGNQIDKTRANYNGSDTTSIDNIVAGESPFGLYNMAGNVWEWVNDWYDGSYYQSSPSINPQGPSTGLNRIVRGGSWGVDPGSTNSANRFEFYPRSMSYATGFRCAHSP